MQAEKAIADGELVDPSAFDDPPEPVDAGLRLHAVASGARTAVAMTAAARPAPRPGEFDAVMLFIEKRHTVASPPPATRVHASAWALIGDECHSPNVIPLLLRLK